MLFRIKRPFFAVRLFAAVLAISAISLTQVAIASPPAVEAMANKARKAYDAADFAEAARLYYQAWQADAARGIWLYSAARSAQKAGIWDDAAEWFEKFLAAPGDGAEKLAAARTNLAEVQKERVKTLLRKAEQASTPALGYNHARAAAELAQRDAAIWLQAAEMADKSAMLTEAAFCYSQVVRFGLAGSAPVQAASRRLRVLPPGAAREAKMAVNKADAGHGEPSSNKAPTEATGDKERPKSAGNDKDITARTGPLDRGKAADVTNKDEKAEAGSKLAEQRVDVAQPRSDTGKELNRPLIKKWWFWTIVAVVVGGVVAAIALNSGTKVQNSEGMRGVVYSMDQNEAHLDPVFGGKK